MTTVTTRLCLPLPLFLPGSTGGLEHVLHGLRDALLKVMVSRWWDVHDDHSLSLSRCDQLALNRENLTLRGEPHTRPVGARVST